jgi:hypothetical protein
MPSGRLRSLADCGDPLPSDESRWTRYRLFYTKYTYSRKTYLVFKAESMLVEPVISGMADVSPAGDGDDAVRL